MRKWIVRYMVGEHERVDTVTAHGLSITESGALKFTNDRGVLVSGYGRGAWTTFVLAYGEDL